MAWAIKSELPACKNFGVRPLFLIHTLSLWTCLGSGHSLGVFQSSLDPLKQAWLTPKLRFRDAWSFSCPQKRSRIIITIAAPGLTPLPEPAHTHSHPDGTMGGSLGKTANGLHTGSRTDGPTPFEYVTSADATKDLPATDARTICIPIPDHRMSRTLPTTGWVRVSSIPRYPFGSSFVKAVNQGYMPQLQIEAFKWEQKIRSRNDSSAWQRVRPDALMATIMTAPRPEDGAGGACLHWEDHRLLTTQEARRAQGFPDYEVLIGKIFEQWKIVGNSVPRPVALALGISLRTVWLANTTKPNPLAVRVKVPIKDSLSGICSDHKTENPTLAASEEAVRNGWSAKHMLNKLKLTAGLTAPKALTSAISYTIGEPLTKKGHHLPTNPKSDHVDAVKNCETGIRPSGLITNAAYGASRPSSYRSEDDGTSDTSNTLAHSPYTKYAPENYSPMSFHEKTISASSVTRDHHCSARQF